MDWIHYKRLEPVFQFDWIANRWRVVDMLREEGCWPC